MIVGNGATPAGVASQAWTRVSSVDGMSRERHGRADRPEAASMRVSLAPLAASRATTLGGMVPSSIVVRTRPSARKLAAPAAELPMARAPVGWSMRRTTPSSTSSRYSCVADLTDAMSRTCRPSTCQSVGCRSPAMSGRSKRRSVPSGATTRGRFQPVCIVAARSRPVPSRAKVEVDTAPSWRIS